LRDVWRRVDLVKTLTGLHFAAFGELTAQHDAVHPRAHLRHEESIGAARQFGDDRHGRRLDGDDADFGCLLWRGRLFWSARCQQYGSRRGTD
jgi:hypothetical protein